MQIRLIKAIIVSTIALFFSLVAFNNLTDFETNRDFIVQVVTMDSVHNENISWRAVCRPQIQLLIYYLFILWEILTALICWLGAYQIIRHIHAKNLALIGITMGFVNYMVGFVDLASEWFYLWQSELKGGQIKAILFSLLMLLSLTFVASNTNQEIIVD